MTNRIPTNFYEYLSGSAFSTGHTFRYNINCHPSRLSLLEKICHKKSVIHIGCCDHIPCLDEKIKAKTWLHGLLSETSKTCLGIDINGDSIDAVKRMTGYDNVIQGDVTKSGLHNITSKHWDVAIFGEIMEHIGDPVSFLRNFCQIYGDSVSEIVVTVPNSMSIRNAYDSLRQAERINTDHRFWFSPFTISKILWDAGYKVTSIETTYSPSNQLHMQLLKRLLLKLFPLLGDGIVVMAVKI